MNQAGLQNEFFTWLQGFGYGVKGFLALGMALAAAVIAWCVPKMFKALLEHRKDTRETKLETKRLDLEIVTKLEGLAERGLVAKVTQKEKKR